MTFSATDHMWEILKRDIVRDDDLGYPEEVGLLACDQSGWENTLWKDLCKERRATIVIDKNALETMFIPVERPLPLRLLDRARRRVSVQIRWRRGLDGPNGDVRMSLSRAGIAAMDLGGDPGSSASAHRS